MQTPHNWFEELPQRHRVERTGSQCVLTWDDQKRLVEDLSPFLQQHVSKRGDSMTRAGMSPAKGTSTKHPSWASSASILCRENAVTCLNAGAAGALMQVFASYGPKSSGELLICYGFCPPPGSNPHDAFHLDLEVDQRDPLYVQKAEVLTKRLVPGLFQLKVSFKCTSLLAASIFQLYLYTSCNFVSAACLS